MKEEQERVRELIINRNYYGAEEYLDSIQVKRSTREAFASLNGLLGGVDILEKAKKYRAQFQRRDGPPAAGENL